MEKGIIFLCTLSLFFSLGYAATLKNGDKDANVTPANSLETITSGPAVQGVINKTTHASTTSTSTLSPTTTTTPSNPNTTTTSTTPTPTSSSTSKPTSTPSPKTTTTSPSPPPSTTTITPPPSPSSTTITPPPSPTPVPKPDRSFDLPSFVGGIILALGVLAIGYVVYKFYRARTDPNYRSL